MAKHRSFSFGQKPASVLRLTPAQAREFARQKPGDGLIWCHLPYGDLRVPVACYSDGSVWMGTDRVVPTPPDPSAEWDASIAGFIHQLQQDAHATDSAAAYIEELREVLAEAIEQCGHRLCGPTDSRAAEDGEPVWVCRARELLAQSRIPK